MRSEQAAKEMIVIGAGAAGLFAAGAAVRAGKRVTVLEHESAPGQKLLITGKGRCNVANNCTAEEFLKHVRSMGLHRMGWPVAG